jgi:hypothetical protein
VRADAARDRIASARTEPIGVGDQTLRDEAMLNITALSEPST